MFLCCDETRYSELSWVLLILCVSDALLFVYLCVYIVEPPVIGPPLLLGLLWGSVAVLTTAIGVGICFKGWGRDMYYTTNRSGTLYVIYVAMLLFGISMHAVVVIGMVLWPIETRRILVGVSCDGNDTFCGQKYEAMLHKYDCHQGVLLIVMAHLILVEVLALITGMRFRSYIQQLYGTKLDAENGLLRESYSDTGCAEQGQLLHASIAIAYPTVASEPANDQAPEYAHCTDLCGADLSTMVTATSGLSKDHKWSDAHELEDHLEACTKSMAHAVLAHAAKKDPANDVVLQLFSTEAPVDKTHSQYSVNVWFPRQFLALWVREGTSHNSGPPFCAVVAMDKGFRRTQACEFLQRCLEEPKLVLPQQLQSPGGHSRSMSLSSPIEGGLSPSDLKTPQGSRNRGPAALEAPAKQILDDFQNELKRADRDMELRNQNVADFAPQDNRAQDKGAKSEYLEQHWLRLEMPRQPDTFISFEEHVGVDATRRLVELEKQELHKHQQARGHRQTHTGASIQGRRFGDDEFHRHDACVVA